MLTALGILNRFEEIRCAKEDDHGGINQEKRGESEMLREEEAISENSRNDRTVSHRSYERGVLFLAVKGETICDQQHAACE